jgi:hypothetical protein
MGWVGGWVEPTSNRAFTIVNGLSTSPIVVLASAPAAIFPPWLNTGNVETLPFADWVCFLVATAHGNAAAKI